MEFDSHMGSRSKMANGLTIDIETPQQLIEAGGLLNFLILLFFVVQDSAGIAMGELDKVLRLKGSEEDLFEVLDVDCTVAFMKLEKGFITLLIKE